MLALVRMTRSVEAYLHVSSSQLVYDDDQFHNVHSSTSEDERGERNANGIIAKRHREAQGDCEAEISSGGGGLVGSSTRSGVGDEALDHSAAVHHARLGSSRAGCDQPSAGDANDPAYECGKRKRTCLESSSVDRPWVSSAEDAPPFGGWGNGSGVKCMEVAAIDGSREDGGSRFRGNKSAHHLVEPQPNSSHVQPPFHKPPQILDVQDRCSACRVPFVLPVSYFHVTSVLR